MDTVIVVGAAAAALIALEQRWPGVRLPPRRGWWPRALLLNLSQVGVVYLGACSWDRWLPHARLWDASALGEGCGAVLGYVVITFVYYWWHRARHESPFLWRHLHQVHHSAARIEVLTSFYKHPLEIAINGVLSSSVLHLLVGLPPATAAITVTLTGIAELIYHWNAHTPHWLGYWFQRPESHRHHHASGWHRENYSDLPLWDILFGTFHNPRVTPAECGFSEAAERQLWQMLLGRTPR